MTQRCYPPTFAPLQFFFSRLLAQLLISRSRTISATQLKFQKYSMDELGECKGEEELLGREEEK